MGGFRKKIDYLLKHNPFIYKLFYIFGSMFFRILGLFCPIKQNRIIFTAHGRLYNDSPRAIYETMLKDSRFENFDFIWGVEKPKELVIPGNPRKVQIDSLKYFIYALSSKYWVTCVNIERGLKFKKKKTIYLNTWHGFPIKGTGINKNRKAENYSHIDYFCVTGDFDFNYYKDCFSIPESHFLFSGFPRMDTLYQLKNDEIIELKQKLGLDNRKVILYAPTWRDSKDSGNNYSIQFPVDFKKWEAMLSNDYILLLRLHPYITKCVEIEYNDFVRDYSTYSNINDLLKVSDILISDYSGTFFEYCVLERPVICFGYDIDEYIKERGISIDLEKEMPGGVVKDEDSVIKRIINMDYDNECEQTKKLKNKYIHMGGNAIDICIKALIENKR